MAAVHPKQTCAAFGCKRWSRKFPPGWSFLCRDHHQSVPKALRRLHSRCLRRARKFDTPAMWKREARVWARCVKEANMAQFGF